MILAASRGLENRPWKKSTTGDSMRRSRAGEGEARKWQRNNRKRNRHKKQYLTRRTQTDRGKVLHWEIVATGRGCRSDASHPVRAVRRGPLATRNRKVFRYNLSRQRKLHAGSHSLSSSVTAPGANVIHRFVFHNDEVKPVEKTRWSPGQGGLICGWGLFTTVRIVRGEAFAYERHWRRLEKDAALIRLPLIYSGARVRVQLQELIRTNRVKEGCARIYLVWNTVGSWKSDEKMAEVDLVITTADLPHYPEMVRLALREHGRHAASPLAGVKTISWLDSVWAAEEAKREGYDEVVLLNERGEVSECTAANIFAVRNDKVITPPLSSGCLEGVTRGVLMEIAAEAGTAVVEQAMRPEDLYVAEEVFITSTNRNVIGVKEIAGLVIGSGVTGELTKKLDEAFEAYLNDYVDRRLTASR